MPELPEVETTRLGLLPHLQGKCIAQVTLHCDTLRWPITKGIEKALKGMEILDISRRAKYLLFDVQGEYNVLSHLGMSGSFRLERKGFNLLTHDHVVWSLSNNAQLVYHDPRRFGAMMLIKKAEIAMHPLLCKLGPEPLSREFSANYLAGALASRKGPIKTTIMDQSVVVGVGNIYASESLFRAKLHPDMPACNVAQHAEILVKSIKSVLRDAIASGGSTLRDYKQVSGELGYFQHRFDVYERKGQPCVACGDAIVHAVHAGRSTYSCPTCQAQRGIRKKH